MVLKSCSSSKNVRLVKENLGFKKSFFQKPLSFFLFLRTISGNSNGLNQIKISLDFNQDCSWHILKNVNLVFLYGLLCCFYLFGTSLDISFSNSNWRSRYQKVFYKRDVLNFLSKQFIFNKLMALSFQLSRHQFKHFLKNNSSTGVL